jgi:hypothetical protein
MLWISLNHSEYDIFIGVNFILYLSNNLKIRRESIHPLNAKTICFQVEEDKLFKVCIVSQNLFFNKLTKSFLVISLIISIFQKIGFEKISICSSGLKPYFKKFAMSFSSKVFIRIL